MSQDVKVELLRSQGLYKVMIPGRAAIFVRGQGSSLSEAEGLRAARWAWQRTRRKPASVTRAKARQVLHDGKISGKPITPAQRGYFGSIATRRHANGLDADLRAAERQAQASGTEKDIRRYARLAIRTQDREAWFKAYELAAQIPDGRLMRALGKLHRPDRNEWQSARSVPAPSRCAHGKICSLQNCRHASPKGCRSVDCKECRHMNPPGQKHARSRSRAEESYRYEHWRMRKHGEPGQKSKVYAHTTRGLTQIAVGRGGAVHANPASGPTRMEIQNLYAVLRNGGMAHARAVNQLERIFGIKGLTFNSRGDIVNYQFSATNPRRGGGKARRKMCPQCGQDVYLDSQGRFVWHTYPDLSGGQQTPRTCEMSDHQVPRGGPPKPPRTNNGARRCNGCGYDVPMAGGSMARHRNPGTGHECSPLTGRAGNPRCSCGGNLLPLPGKGFKFQCSACGKGYQPALPRGHNPLSPREAKSAERWAAGQIRSGRRFTRGDAQGIFKFGQAAGIAEAAYQFASKRVSPRQHDRLGKAVNLAVAAETRSATHDERGGHPSFRHSWPPKPTPAPLTLYNSGECKRCKGAKQVKLGPRMVSCPMCCRKKNRMTPKETLRLLEQGSGQLDMARSPTITRDGRLESAAVAYEDGAVVRQFGAKALSFDGGMLQSQAHQARAAVKRERNPLDSHKPDCRCFFHKRLRGES